MEGRKEDSGRRTQEGSRTQGASGRQGRQGANGSQAGSIREGREQMKAQRTKGMPDIWRAYEKGIPLPFAERQVPFIPIIFRTKNTEKSRLGLIGKNFGKNLWENVSGKGKPPILWRGGETLK